MLQASFNLKKIFKKIKYIQITSTLHQMWALKKHRPKNSFQNEAQEGTLQTANSPAKAPLSTSHFCRLSGAKELHGGARREWEQAHMQHWLENM